MIIGELQPESRQKNNPGNYQLLPSDLLIAEVNVFTPEKVTDKTHKRVTTGKTWYGRFLYTGGFSISGTCSSGGCSLFGRP